MNVQIPILVENAPLSAPPPTAAPEHVAIPGPPPVLVRVGDTAISEAEIAREMQHHRADDPHQARIEAVRALVVRELLRREIERQNIDAGIEPEGAETQEEAAIRVLIEREVPVPQPNDVDCRRWFEQNRERMHAPDRARLRHILLAAAPSDVAARGRARELGEALIARLREQPELFGELAAQHSACPSKQDGGDLGWIEAGDTVPEFERQVFRLKSGLAGLTVETRYGHHVVHVDAVEPGASLDYENCRDRIAAYLEAQVRQNALHQYLHILAQRHPVVGLPPD